MASRREVLRALALAAIAPSPSWAQRMRRIGFLGAGSAAGFANHIAGLRAGLREQGYEERKNLTIEFRWAEGRIERLPGLARELLRSPVELLVTQGTPATRAAKEATSSVPIVMAAVGDAVVTGLVQNLARPGRNLTGTTFFAVELASKRLELLKQAFGQVTRVGMMHNPDNPIQREPLLAALRRTASTLKIHLEVAVARTPDDFSGAFARLAAARVEGVLFIEDPIQVGNAGALMKLVVQNRLASASGLEFVPAGTMLAYGVNFREVYGRAAVYVARILNGANPAELPVEQATRFELVVNPAAAKALGFSIAPAVLQRADRVVE